MALDYDPSTVKGFARLLKEINACEDARREFRGMTLQQAWDACDIPSWMEYLLWDDGPTKAANGFQTAARKRIAAIAYRANSPLSKDDCDIIRKICPRPYIAPKRRKRADHSGS